MDILNLEKEDGIYLYNKNELQVTNDNHLQDVHTRYKNLYVIDVSMQ